MPVRSTKGFLFLLPLLGLYAPAALAMGDAGAGRTIAMQGNGKGAVACVSCHGAAGEGNAAAGFPRLAGLNAEYLVKQLQDYKAGTRRDPVMQPFGASLTSQEMRDVAAYYAGLEPPDGQGTADDNALGETLALRGDWDNDIPACVSCHGPGGRGIDPYFPAIAGQHAGYIRSQIQAWKSGARQNDPNDLMRVVAERMTDEQIEAVSRYFAAQPPVKPTSGDKP